MPHAEHLHYLRGFGGIYISPKTFSVSSRSREFWLPAAIQFPYALAIPCRLLLRTLSSEPVLYPTEPPPDWPQHRAKLGQAALPLAALPHSFPQPQGDKALVYNRLLLEAGR